jgi:hypothetical protein
MPNDETGHFGISVSIHEHRALIGADGDEENGHQSGAAYIFEDHGSGWRQVAKLLPDDGAPGDLFGDAVAISGDTAVIGAKYDDDFGDMSGAAYVFRNGQNGWTQVAKLTAGDGPAAHIFGGSVAIDGDTILIGAGAAVNDHGVSSGAAYVFVIPEPATLPLLLSAAAASLLLYHRRRHRARGQARESAP